MVFNNLIDSPLDERDHIYENVCGISKGDEIPKRWISPYYPVYNQKSSMWCVGYASTALYSIIQYMISNGVTKLDFSKEFVMFNAKENDGLPLAKGTTLRTVCKNAVDFGFCPESFCETTNLGELRGEIKKPSDKAYKAALNYRLEAYARVYTLDGILNAIYKNAGVLVSTLYYGEMLHSINGYIAEPSALATKLGNHCTCYIGYDVEKEIELKGITYKGFFIQLNSYGTEQGRMGIEFVPFDALNWYGGRNHNEQILREFWVFYNKKDVVQNRFFIENQQEGELIKDAQKINIKLTIGSDIAFVDDKEFKLPRIPIVKNNSTFLPMRCIFEMCGCDVSYTKREDGHHDIAAVDRNTYSKVSMNIGYNVGYINGDTYVMQEAPFIYNSSTYVGVRAVGEMLGAKVDYNKNTKEITLTRI